MSAASNTQGGDENDKPAQNVKEKYSRRYNKYAAESQKEANSLEISISKQLIGICGVFLPLLALSLQSHYFAESDRASLALLMSGALLFLSATAGLVHFAIARSHVRSFMRAYDSVSRIAAAQKDSASEGDLNGIRDEVMAGYQQDSAMWALATQIVLFLLGSLGVLAAVGFARFHC